MRKFGDAVQELQVVRACTRSLHRSGLVCIMELSALITVTVPRAKPSRESKRRSVLACDSCVMKDTELENSLAPREFYSLSRSVSPTRHRRSVLACDARARAHSTANEPTLFRITERGRALTVCPLQHPHPAISFLPPFT